MARSLNDEDVRLAKAWIDALAAYRSRLVKARFAHIHVPGSRPQYPKIILDAEGKERVVYTDDHIGRELKKVAREIRRVETLGH